jgi:2'-5' RNA ligase
LTDEGQWLQLIARTMRTFIAIEVPEKIRKQIDDVITDEKKRGLPIKWVQYENLHITLKFLGEIDENKKREITPVLQEIANKVTPFHISLEGIGCFPTPKNPRVVWVGVIQGKDPLCAIVQNVETALSCYGFKQEKRFHPHLTIGRIKKVCNIVEILERQVASEPFLIDSIVLFKSTLKPEGPTYEVLQKFPFGAQ